MSSDFRIRKLANAFSSRNELVPEVGYIPTAGAAALDAVDGYRRRHGGVWVGGAVEISAEGISFRANTLNKILHTGETDLTIPMPSVRSVHWQFGWLTGIVVVTHDIGEFRFRCFGAKSVARRLSAHLAAIGPAIPSDGVAVNPEADR